MACLRMILIKDFVKQDGFCCCRKIGVIQSSKILVEYIIVALLDHDCDR